MPRLFLMLCALVVTVVPTFAQDASGRWQLTVTTPDREPRSTSMMLKKNGDKLSGTLIGLQGDEIVVGGTQVQADVSLSFTVSTQNGPVPISMKGRQDGDSMKGTLFAGSDTQGQWTAVRTVPPGTSAVDLTGTWAFQVLIEAGTRTPTVALKQQGENLTGRYKSQLGESAVTGKVTGTSFSFDVTLPIEGTPLTVTYSGAAREGGLSGRVVVDGAQVGTFTAKKEGSGEK
jgi:hypothetical protein